MALWVFGLFFWSAVAFMSCSRYMFSAGNVGLGVCGESWVNGRHILFARGLMPETSWPSLSVIVPAVSAHLYDLKTERLFAAVFFNAHCGAGGLQHLQCNDCSISFLDGLSGAASQAGLKLSWCFLCLSGRAGETAAAGKPHLGGLWKRKDCKKWQLL